MNKQVKTLRNSQFPHARAPLASTPPRPRRSMWAAERAGAATTSTCPFFPHACDACFAQLTGGAGRLAQCIQEFCCRDQYQDCSRFQVLKIRGPANAPPYLGPWSREEARILFDLEGGESA
jgi:hypothetical protein